MVQITRLAALSQPRTCDFRMPDQRTAGAATQGIMLGVMLGGIIDRMQGLSKCWTGIREILDRSPTIQKAFAHACLLSLTVAPSTEPTGKGKKMEGCCHTALVAVELRRDGGRNYQRSPRVCLQTFICTCIFHVCAYKRIVTEISLK